MMPGMTLLLSRSDLEQVLDVRACLEVLRRSFLAAPSAIAPQRIRTDLPGPGTATVLLPGLVPDIPAYSVKVNAKFPRSRPALRGLVGLHDTGTGELLAVLDSATVTAWRTGLAAAWPPTNWPVPRRARWRSSARGPRRNWCCGDGPHCARGST